MRGERGAAREEFQSTRGRGVVGERTEKGTLVQHWSPRCAPYYAPVPLMCVATARPASQGAPAAAHTQRSHEPDVRNGMPRAPYEPRYWRYDLIAAGADSGGFQGALHGRRARQVRASHRSIPRRDEPVRCASGHVVRFPRTFSARAAPVARLCLI